MRNEILAVAASVTILLGAMGAQASGNNNHNSGNIGTSGNDGNDATGIGNVKQKGGININFQGSNDENTINNTINSIQGTGAGGIANLNNNSNTNTNTNTNNNDNTNTNTNTNTNNNNSSATATANGGNGGDGGDGGSSDVNVNVSGDDAAASGAAPTYLTTSNDTCMGSSGVGGQGMSFGFSIGTTWTDSNCVMLKNSRELRNQGHAKAAKARLCMDDDNALAFELAGDPCPQALKSAQSAVAYVEEWKGGQSVATTSTTSRTQTAKFVPAIETETVDSDE